METLHLAVALMAVLIPAASGQAPGCYPACWEACLANPGRYVSQYRYLLELVTRTRAARAAARSRGTVFLVDSAADAPTLKYQQTLAQIVAITLPVEYTERYPNKSCNPFFYVQYWQEGSSGYHKGQCLDHCQAASFLRPEDEGGAIKRHPESTVVDLLEPACMIGDIYRDDHANIPCSKNRYHSYNELAIAFANSNDQHVSAPANACGAFSNKVLVRTGTAYSSVGNFQARTDIWAQTYRFMQPAADQLLRCVRAYCCRGLTLQSVSKPADSDAVIFARKGGRPVETKYAELKKYEKLEQNNVIKA